MKLTKKQKAALHWFAKRDCKESIAVDRVLRNPSKRHGPQVRRHGLGRTIYSLGRRGLLQWQDKTEDMTEGYVFTEEGRAVEQRIWEKRRS